MFFLLHLMMEVKEMEIRGKLIPSFQFLSIPTKAIQALILCLELRLWGVEANSSADERDLLDCDHSVIVSVVQGERIDLR